MTQARLRRAIRRYRKAVGRSRIAAEAMRKEIDRINAETRETLERVTRVGVEFSAAPDDGAQA